MKYSKIESWKSGSLSPARKKERKIKTKTLKTAVLAVDVMGLQGGLEEG